MKKKKDKSVSAASGSNARLIIMGAAAHVYTSNQSDETMRWPFQSDKPSVSSCPPFLPTALLVIAPGSPHGAVTGLCLINLHLLHHRSDLGLPCETMASLPLAHRERFSELPARTNSRFMQSIGGHESSGVPLTNVAPELRWRGGGPARE